MSHLSSRSLEESGWVFLETHLRSGSKHSRVEVQLKHPCVALADAHDDEEREGAEEGEEVVAEAVARRPAVAVEQVRAREGREDLAWATTSEGASMVLPRFQLGVFERSMEDFRRSIHRSRP